MGIDIELWRARIGLFSGGRGCRPQKGSHKLSCGKMISGLLTLICVGIMSYNSIIEWGIQQIGKKRNRLSCQLLSLVNPDSVCGKAFAPVNGAILLYSLAYLLIMAGDVEQNPGPAIRKMNAYCTVTNFV